MTCKNTRPTTHNRKSNKDLIQLLSHSGKDCFILPTKFFVPSGTSIRHKRQWKHAYENQLVCHKLAMSIGCNILPDHKISYHKNWVIRILDASQSSFLIRIIKLYWVRLYINIASPIASTFLLGFLMTKIPESEKKSSMSIHTKIREKRQI